MAGTDGRVQDGTGTDALGVDWQEGIVEFGRGESAQVTALLGMAGMVRWGTVMRGRLWTGWFGRNGALGKV